MEENFDLLSESSSSNMMTQSHEDHHEENEWQTVTYHRRRNRRQRHAPPPILRFEWNGVDKDADVSIIDEFQPENGDVAETQNDGGEDAARINEKPKKVKVTVADAAAHLNAPELVVFLADVSETYKSTHDLQLMRLADYFGSAFAKVGYAQFPWVKLLKGSSISRVASIPLSNVSEEIVTISMDWLRHFPIDALTSFALWSLDTIIRDLVFHRIRSKSQVALFMILAMVLRVKPDVLISLFPIIKDNEKYKGNSMLPLMAWMVTQALEEDLAVGMYMWIRFLFKDFICESNSIYSQLSNGLILQVVERILSFSKARTILVHSAVKKGERLIPPSALELLMKIAFSSSLNIPNETQERLEAIYPTLKEIAVAAPPGSKALKQITQQIMDFAIIAAGQGVPKLSEEASKLCVWCLIRNHGCYKQWESVYLENIEGSVVILEKLLDEWDSISAKTTVLEPLKETIKNFRVKNATAMGDKSSDGLQESLKAADKCCEQLLGQTTPANNYCKKVLIVAMAVAGVLAAFFLKDY